MPSYGQRPDDVVQDTKGNALQGVTISFYDSESAAEAGGTSLGTTTTDNRGRWRFTPATDGELWARLPDATVWQVSPGRQATAAEVDAAIAAAVTPKADQSALDGVISGSTEIPYVKAATLNLPNPCYIAHRGGAGVAPEETMEAFRTAVANGADALEMDCQPLADGALALMHDSTVSRTTDGTGNVSGFTAPAWRALNAAAKFPWNGRVVPPALLSEVVAESGGKTPLFIEPKDASSAGQIMDLCDAAGVKGSVVIEASESTVLTAAKARGYAVYYWWGTVPGSGSMTVEAAIAAGADYLGLDGANATDANVSALVAYGKPVIVYTINRRYDRDRLLALGVQGFITDQPAYLRGTTAQRTTDSWQQGVFGHGLGPATGTLDLITITSGVLQPSQADYSSNVVGEVCPLANAAGSYTIDVDMGFNVMPTSGGSVTLVFGRPDDRRKNLEIASGFPDGYLVLMRATGGLSLYRLTEGSTTATLLGSTVTTAALTAGVFAHIKVTVTPTQITVQRTDSAGTIGPVTDSTHRGGYIALGKKDAYTGTVQFKNLVVA